MADEGMAQPAGERRDELIVVVFVHGLGGSPEKTWRHDRATRSLPEFVADYADVTVAQFHYPTSRLRFNLFSPSPPPIDGLARSLITELQLRHDDHEHIVIVGHSLGGLVARRAVVMVHESGELPESGIRRLVLMGTPNDGNHLANIAQLISLRHKQLRDLARNSEFVNDLMEGWQQVDPPVPVTVVIGEMDTTVSPESAGAVDGARRFSDPYDDHRSVVRPEAHDDVSVLAVLDAIESVDPNAIRDKPGQPTLGRIETGLGGAIGRRRGPIKRTTSDREPVTHLVTTFGLAAGSFATWLGIAGTLLALNTTWLVGTGLLVALASVVARAATGGQGGKPAAMLGFATVLFGTALGVSAWQHVGDDSPWNNIPDNNLVFAVADLDGTTDAERRVAANLKTLLLGELDGSDTDLQRTVLQVGRPLDAESVGDWVEAAPRPVELVLYGSVARVPGTESSFLVDWRIFSNTRAPSSFLPLGLDESLGLDDELVLDATLQAGEPGASLLAAIDVSEGALAVAADRLELATERFDRARALIAGDDNMAEVPALLNGLDAFVEVVQAGQQNDRSAIGEARDKLGAALGIDSPPGAAPTNGSDFALSTFLTTWFLAALDDQQLDPLPPCINDEELELVPDVAALAELRELLPTLAAADAEPGVLNANALSLLGRVELLHWLVVDRESPDAWPPPDSVADQFRLLIDRYGGEKPDAPDLELWVSDAHANLGVLQRGDRPTRALVSIQQARSGATPFYDAAYVAELAHIFHCQLNRASVADELALETAACYYAVADAILPRGNDQLADSIDKRASEAGSCAFPRLDPEVLAHCFLRRAAEVGVATPDDADDFAVLFADGAADDSVACNELP